MALAKNAKQPVRGAAAMKSAKAGLKAAPVKVTSTAKAKEKPAKAAGKPAAKAVLKPTAAKATVAKAATPVKAVPVPPVPKAKKSAAEQPKVTAIGAAKAALKKESAEKRPSSPKAQAAAAPGPTPAPAKAKARKISIDANANEAASALSAKWNSLYKKAEQIDAKPYNMKAVFEEKTAIVHKVLGWGFILANRNDRLEVLFKDGIKYLISNYKP